MQLFKNSNIKNLIKIKNEKNFFSLMKGSQYFFCTTATNRDILSGTFNYAETFSSFLESTDQKQETAMVLGNFAKHLKDNGVLFTENRPIKIADLGCADAKTACQFIKNMNINVKHLSGFDYFGIEISSEFINKAKKVLSTEPSIKRYTLIQEDALDGSIIKNEKIRSELFDFIFISHTAYYLKNHLHSRPLITDIEMLLSKCGVAIFLHEDNTHYFRAMYNEENFRKISTPLLLEQAAQVVNRKYNQFISNHFISKLRFAPLSDDLWQAMKNPKKYSALSHIPNFTKTLEILAFIVHRDLHGMAEEGTLSDYIDEIRETITVNDNCFNLKTHMQTLVEPKCILRHKIAKSLEDTFRELPNLETPVEVSKKASFL